MSAEIADAVVALLERCRQQGLRIAVAESCTGGMIAAALTAAAGSSDVFECGFVTYSNAAKHRLLGVPADLIAMRGAVSAEVARAMAAGALARSEADLAAAATGIAGPGGGSPAKPVGLVHIAAGRRGGPMLHEELRLGDIGRAAVREASVRAAVALLQRAAASALA